MSRHKKLKTKKPVKQMAAIESKNILLALSGTMVMMMVVIISVDNVISVLTLDSLQVLGTIPQSKNCSAFNVYEGPLPPHLEPSSTSNPADLSPNLGNNTSSSSGQLANANAYEDGDIHDDGYYAPPPSSIPTSSSIRIPNRASPEPSMTSSKDSPKEVANRTLRPGTLAPTVQAQTVLISCVVKKRIVILYLVETTIDSNNMKRTPSSLIISSTPDAGGFAGPMAMGMSVGMSGASVNTKAVPSSIGIDFEVLRDHPFNRDVTALEWIDGSLCLATPKAVCDDSDGDDIII